MRGKDLLANGTVRLRAPEPEDLEVMYHMENLPELWAVSNATVPYSRHVLRKYIEQCSNDIFVDRELRLMVELRGESKVVGTVDLIDYSPLHGRAEVGVAILEAYRRKGLARQAVGLVCEYARRVLFLHQLYVYVAADNAASLELFESCGFAQKVLLRGWLRREEGYVDVYVLQRFIS